MAGFSSTSSIDRGIFNVPSFIIFGIVLRNEIDRKGVVYRNWKFFEDVAGFKSGLSQAIQRISHGFLKSACNTLPFHCESVLLVLCHESRVNPVCFDAGSSRRASSSVIHQGACCLVQFLLVVILVLDEVLVDEIAQVGTDEPSNTIRILS